MDLSKLSDADLAQIAKGDMRMVSEEGLRMIAGDFTAPSSLTPEQIKEHSKASQKSFVRGQRGAFQNTLTDMLGGATSLGSSIFNKAADITGSPLLRSEFSNMATDKKSGAYLAGSLLDPIAASIGAGAFDKATMIPKLPSYLKNIIGGAASGGVIGGLSEDGSATSGAMIGGLIPAVVGPAGYVGGKVWDIGRNLVSGPIGQAKSYLAEMFGDRANRGKYARILENMKSGLPDEQLTVGRGAVSGDVPVPQFKALEESARSRPFMAERFSVIDKTNAEARARPLEAIAAPGARVPAAEGMPVNKSRAESIRESITSPLYKQAGKDVVPVDDALLGILGGAEIQGAAKRAGASLDQAITNATVAGKTPPAGYTPPKTIQPAPGTPYWAMNPSPQPTVTPGTVSINALQRIKNEIDKEVASLIGASDSAGALRLSQLKTARGQLDKWMRGSSSNWAAAQDTFKALSAPQNQADVAKVLLDALKSPSDIERAAAFGTAFRNAPQTITKAGVPRFEELGQVLSPTQMKWASAVKESVDRKAQYAALPAKASILPEVSNAIDAANSAMPNWLNVAMTSFRKVLSKAGGRLDEQSQMIIDGMMTDPSKFAAFLREATPAEKDIVMRYIGRIPKGVPTAEITSATQARERKQKRGLLNVSEE